MDKDIGLLQKWWFSIDSITLVLTLVLVTIGGLLITTASPAVAERIGLNPFYFVQKHFIFLFAAIIIILILSLLDIKTIKKISLFGFIAFLLLMVAVLFIGEEVKGAKRWITITSFSLQPSEFIKPFLSIIIALVLSERYTNTNLPAFKICSLLYLTVAILLVLQPDIGMTISITIVTASQFFIAGLPILWMVLSLSLAMISAFGAYMFLPHVAKRVNSFISPQINENYQVEKSLKAYVNGGLTGRGPGEGVIKNVLPDAHTDFIFAVAGEEFGAIISALIILLFLVIILRISLKLLQEKNLFIIYSTCGLVMYFALQSTFNIGVTLHLFPTKGMTLPFISYGGSSILSFAVIFGMCLALNKRKNNKVR